VKVRVDTETAPNTTEEKVMSIRRTALIIVPVFGLALLGAAAATAAARVGGGMPFCHGDKEDHRAHMEFVANRMLNKVDATDEQKEEIDAILDEAFETVDEKRAEHEAKHEELKAILTAETIDREALEELRGEALAHFDEGSAMFLDVIVEVSEVLTVEQREQLAEMIEERRMK
jgi:Spy/CpxP family protein refolding chaperone